MDMPGSGTSGSWEVYCTRSNTAAFQQAVYRNKCALSIHALSVAWSWQKRSSQAGCALAPGYNVLTSMFKDESVGCLAAANWLVLRPSLADDSCCKLPLRFLLKLVSFLGIGVKGRKSPGKILDLILFWNCLMAVSSYMGAASTAACIPQSTHDLQS